VQGPGDEVRLLLGMQLERGPALLPALRSLVVDARHPARELRLEVVEVVEIAPVEEADAQRAKAQLDVRFVIGMSRTTCSWPK